MKLNYNVYNTRANIVVERDLESYEQAIEIASTMPEWCVASNTIEGRQDFQYTPAFFLDNL
jgi:hypothetical protein